MRGFNEGNITMHVDFRKAYELFTTDSLKESKLEGDGGSIISKIIELKNTSKI